MYNDMNIQILRIEQEAYCSILRAFKAQADAIALEKESLITELLKELRVSDDKHIELLARVNADDVIKRIRSLGASHIVSPSLSMHIHTDSAASNPLIGRRVMTRWPQDYNFYEAVILDYDPLQAQHCLVYDKDTPSETIEWVSLDQIPRESIRWVGEDPSEFIVNSQSAQQIVSNANCSGDKIPEYFEIFDTGTLINEVEKVLNSGSLDPAEIQTAKRMLCEQEQALADAIAVLGRAIDGDTDNEEEEEEQASSSELGQQRSET